MKQSSWSDFNHFGKNSESSIEDIGKNLNDHLVYDWRPENCILNKYCLLGNCHACESSGLVHTSKFGNTFAHKHFKSAANSPVGPLTTYTFAW